MSVTIESQKLATEGTVQLLEFDFTSIDGTAHVYVTTEHMEVLGSLSSIVTNWPDGDGGEIEDVTFNRIDFEMSGISSDLTGSVAEPTLKVAVDSLWALSDWSSAVSGFTIMDYRGIRVRRMRQFCETTGFMSNQVFYVKSVDELSPTTISFTLTPSLGSERVDRPSARKLEL
jgi:hypothetical protein